MKFFDVTGKKAVVTGGSVGLGRAMAEALAIGGAEVIIANRNLEEAEAAAQEMRGAGLKVTAFQVDISKESSVAALFDHVREKFGRLDIMVNNAGITCMKFCEDFELEDWDRISGVNIRGTFMCYKEAGKIMIPQKSGKIINLFSITAHKCLRNGSSFYSVTKQAISQMTKVLAAEWSKYGITVNAIAPGVAITRINEEHYRKNPDLLAKVSAGIPLGRVSTTDEYMGITLFLASSASDYMTGQTLFMDGGMSIV
ncbi:MAG: SDR family oxidoreductase [Mailhella sp.]|nr:SDR family oxidoreductase [Mailhella sp.]